MLSSTLATFFNTSFLNWDPSPGKLATLPATLSHSTQHNSGTVLPLVTKALTYQQKALGAAANLEVFLMPLLIFKLVFGYPFLSFLLVYLLCF